MLVHREREKVPYSWITLNKVLLNSWNSSFGQKPYEKTQKILNEFFPFKYFLQDCAKIYLF